MSQYQRILAEDARTLLRCPRCSAATFAVLPQEVRCQGCAAAFPVDSERQVCSLLGPSAGTDTKQDIREWWGDFYRQRYAALDGKLAAADLDRRLVELEDLFRQRQHLAVVEMPLGELAGKTVLEIGTGAGGHSAIFQKHGASVVGVDITFERAASTALKLSLVGGGGGRSYQADAEALPFRDGSFDIVYSNGVLHHSEDTDRCLAEVYRVLKPGGRAVIMLYSRHSAVYWCNIVPRAILTGEIFRWPEPRWCGRLTEGTPEHGSTRNPITRVYSKREIERAFRAFRIVSLRKASFQLDNFAVPRLTQIRYAVLKALGYAPHPGGMLIYGADFIPETTFEQWLGRAAGFAWNTVALKP